MKRTRLNVALVTATVLAMSMTLSGRLFFGGREDSHNLRAPAINAMTAIATDNHHDDRHDDHG